MLSAVPSALSGVGALGCGPASGGATGHRTDAALAAYYSSRCERQAGAKSGCGGERTRAEMKEESVLLIRHLPLGQMLREEPQLP